MRFSSMVCDVAIFAIVIILAGSCMKKNQSRTAEDDEPAAEEEIVGPEAPQNSNAENLQRRSDDQSAHCAALQKRLASAQSRLSLLQGQMDHINAVSNKPRSAGSGCEDLFQYLVQCRNRSYYRAWSRCVDSWYSSCGADPCLEEQQQLSKCEDQVAGTRHFDYSGSTIPGEYAAAEAEIAEVQAQLGQCQ